MDPKQYRTKSESGRETLMATAEMNQSRTHLQVAAVRQATRYKYRSSALSCKRVGDRRCIAAPSVDCLRDWRVSLQWKQKRVWTMTGTSQVQHLNVKQAGNPH